MNPFAQKLRIDVDRGVNGVVDRSVFFLVVVFFHGHIFSRELRVVVSRGRGVTVGGANALLLEYDVFFNFFLPSNIATLFPVPILGGKVGVRTRLGVKVRIK